MMYANQPYQKTDRGVGAGLMVGSAIGASALAGMQFGGNRAMSAVRGVTRNAMSGAMASGGSTRGYSGAHKAAVKTGGFVRNANKLAFGHGGLRTAGVYAGVAAVGGLLGMGVDALNG